MPIHKSQLAWTGLYYYSGEFDFYYAGASAPAHILVVFRTITNAMGLRMRRVNRLDRAFQDVHMN